ncbi:hypothetical protein BWI93_02960 [Siphonobacter sp. BAB-5385]|uniref:hypothetical protein n=1 Tax=unclassified Siphonobacter TaxID=2635712 RepID=UPI000B9E2D89|nr:MULTISPECIES: hypothetical protein [unclassified Siphonobacter]OZI09650.1 hypothetical protein BWI93_02960 [Siphonobacter sp. BAB-5385]PMD96948.1 hypothetical protein BWI97_09695 [Siphonobacter sp. BAB-5405]
MRKYTWMALLGLALGGFSCQRAALDPTYKPVLFVMKEGDQCLMLTEGQAWPGTPLFDPKQKVQYLLDNQPTENTQLLKELLAQQQISKIMVGESPRKKEKMIAFTTRP